METITETRLLSVSEYYAGKNIFLTGGTGFIGKVFIEKVLRCCPDVEGIYCLVRPKKGQNGSQRISALCDDKIFERLRSTQPNFADKLHAIHGDIIENDLGIKRSDRVFLEKNINIIFHSAATIKFDEQLRIAVQMNIIAVRRMLELAKSMEKLEVFIHVSTAFTNCDREYIEEVPYPTSVKPQKIIDIVEWMDDESLDAATPMLLGNKPNTYTFTKHLGEALLIDECGDLPAAILRPSIVAASWKEPVAGWIDNLNAYSGIYIAAGKGLLRTLNACPKSIADIIPVDLFANLMIACAWYTALDKPQSKPPIYQITTGMINPLKVSDMETFVLSSLKKTPLEAGFRRPSHRVVRRNRLLHNYWIFMSHVVPARIVDFVRMLLGKTPRMVKLYNRLHKSMEIYQFFMVRTWQWTSENLDALRAALTPDDQKTFYLDVREIQWSAYTENYVKGAKKFILNEDLDNLDQARAHLRMLRNVRFVFNTCLLLVFARFFVAKSQIGRRFWQSFYGLLYKLAQLLRTMTTLKTK